MTAAERVLDHLHPRLALLRVQPAKEAEFWAEVTRDGAPLIQPDPESDAHSIVTFVWRLPAGAKHVVLQPGFGGAPENVMALIPGTGVCHASYRYRRDVRTSYCFFPDMPLISWERGNAEELAELAEFLHGNPPQPDPHHREHFVSRGYPGEPDVVTSVLSLPDALDESLVAKRPDVERGWIDKHMFTSQLLGNDRNIWVYTPPGYKHSYRSYSVLVVFDGGNALTQIPVHRMLDNLIADGAIAPVVAVLIDNATRTSRDNELPCSDSFARFIETEMLPWLRGGYRVSSAAVDHYVTGASYGGLASIWMGYRLPHVFGNVISQAASLWWGPGYKQEVPRGEGGYTPEWLIEQYDNSPRLPVRFWIEIGLLEPLSLMIAPNRRMQALLQAKGYDVTYREFCGGHDPALWRASLAQALEFMLPKPVT